MRLVLILSKKVRSSVHGLSVQGQLVGKQNYVELAIGHLGPGRLAPQVRCTSWGFRIDQGVTDTVDGTVQAREGLKEQGDNN